MRAMAQTSPRQPPLLPMNISVREGRAFFENSPASLYIEARGVAEVTASVFHERGFTHVAIAVGKEVRRIILPASAGFTKF